MNKNDLEVSEYSIGSLWRRWDLHVHTKESKLQSSFSDLTWDEYVDALEAGAEAAEIAVIGVTDYMTIDGYERLLAAYKDSQKPRLRSVALLVPNIEFRALPNTVDGKALNIHLLVDPSDSDHVKQIKRALRNLRVSYGKTTYGCIREELIEFGRAQNPALDEEAAYRYGVSQFKPSYDAILEWLSREGWLSKNSLVGIANGKDGISGLPLDGFSAVREDLLRQCHFVFSANPNDRAHYLGQKNGFPPEKIRELYRTLKPCLHGSDAHEKPQLFKPKDDRFCWIKSDPTFEGLRQVLWEPEARVQISAVKPQLTDGSRVISSLDIADSYGWFTQASVPLNPGLVAIIGEKGAGKTAIADLVAFAAGTPMTLSSQSSFITKGRLHLANMALELTWGGGSRTTGLLTDQPWKAERSLVRYLSQDFVERLCSEDHQGNELQKAIEEVVFSYLDEVHREDFSNFDELRSSRESASQSRQDNFRGQLSSLNREIERLHGSLSQRETKIASKKLAETQIVELKKQLPSVEILADQTVVVQLQAERTARSNAEKEIAELTRSRRGVEDFKKGLKVLEERTARQVQELKDALPASQPLSKGLLDRAAPVWDHTVYTEIDQVVAAFDQAIGGIQGDPNNLDPKGIKLADISARIKVLEESLSKDELNRLHLIDLQKQIAAQEAAVERLTKEVEELDGRISKLLAAKQQERASMYCSFFGVLTEVEEGLRELYAPMKERLSELGADTRFELTVGLRVDWDAWLSKAARFYDGRRPAALAKKDDIERFTAETLVPAWKSGDPEKIRDALTKFELLVAPVDFMSRMASPSLKMVDLFDWMYSIDHVGTTYKIKYGGIELEHLSPGTRGIALLVLYLLMDEDDRRPLVIDQPEGNLDNSSIYQQLVPYIRRAKEKRQIILVTHNPNLVVSTDADQVIVATSERVDAQSYPRITYTSGSLEHSVPKGKQGIRQAVCTLLEGGEQAFKEREGRYSILGAGRPA